LLADLLSATGYPVGQRVEHPPHVGMIFPGSLYQLW
jgi:hypothetical protein